VLAVSQSCIIETRFSYWYHSPFNNTTEWAWHCPKGGVGEVKHKTYHLVCSFEKTVVVAGAEGTFLSEGDKWSQEWTLSIYKHTFLAG
jgi:hypothetical protein